MVLKKSLAIESLVFDIEVWHNSDNTSILIICSEKHTEKQLFSALYNLQINFPLSGYKKVEQ